MFLEVTDKMNGKKKVINANSIYSITGDASGEGSLLRYNEGGDKAKVLQTVESYEKLTGIIFPVRVGEPNGAIFPTLFEDSRKNQLLK